MATLKRAEVAEALRKFNGNMAAAGRKFGVTRQAVFDFVSRSPHLKSVVLECRESMKDHAESALYKAMLEGEAWAVCFFLKTQAKDRGYVERQEHTGEDGRAIEVHLTQEERDVIRARIRAELGGGPGTSADDGTTDPVRPPLAGPMPGDDALGLDA